MPRTLILMRHAQTVSSHPQGDRARTLTPEGIQQATKVGEELKELGVQYALVSTAVRTRETFENLGLGIPAEFHDALYNSDPQTMLQRASETGDDVNVLLVVGHAPTIPSLAAQLSYNSDHREADQLQCWYPPSTYTVVQFDGQWSDLLDDPEHKTELRTIQRPANG